LKTSELPAAKYDFITAMDVFEHIAEPEKAVEPVAVALRPGGILFGRFGVEPDENRPSHIARDFAQMFERLAELAFEECWREAGFGDTRHSAKPGSPNPKRSRGHGDERDRRSVAASYFHRKRFYLDRPCRSLVRNAKSPCMYFSRMILR
jgi:SAM-dependent methyltransferase